MFDFFLHALPYPCKIHATTLEVGHEVLNELEAEIDVRDLLNRKTPNLLPASGMRLNRKHAMIKRYPHDVCPKEIPISLLESLIRDLQRSKLHRPTLLQSLLINLQ